MKKIIGIYLLLQAAMKGVCFFLSLSSDESFLPVIVLVTCAVLMAGAVYVAAMTFMEKARLRQISRFFVLEIAYRETPSLFLPGRHKMHYLNIWQVGKCGFCCFWKFV